MIESIKAAIARLKPGSYAPGENFARALALLAYAAVKSESAPSDDMRRFLSIQQIKDDATGEGIVASFAQAYLATFPKKHPYFIYDELHGITVMVVLRALPVELDAAS